MNTSDLETKLSWYESQEFYKNQEHINMQNNINNLQYENLKSSHRYNN